MPKKRIKAPTEAAPVTSYKHKDTRVHIPTQEESIKLTAREKQPVKKKYDYDPSLDPQLIWAGKKEAGSELGVSTVPIYVQENIAPEAIVARVKAGVDENAQMLLFGETTQSQIHKAVEFYKHEDNWQNRMILGDSLLVMNSLLEKEGMRGRVQTIYIDPPYGIKFGSNWQTSTRNREVKDNKVEDFIRQPEQVKAFRDTWELGIHSYLSYLRDRFIVSRELLNESGSLFVQINNENVHLVRTVMDEVFGSENFISIISFQKTGSISGDFLGSTVDYIVWYSKDRNLTKYRQIFDSRTTGDSSLDRYDRIELFDGSTRRLTVQEIRGENRLPEGKRYRLQSIYSSGETKSGSFDFKWNGETFPCLKGNHWKTTSEGLKKLGSIGRLEVEGKRLRYKRYLDDFPVIPISDRWSSVQIGTELTYVVQTSTEVIRRCVLMTSDPGDIVLDPTCGSGTTAFVAEQWGRRWVTIDTSRVALALARTRLMTAKMPYYKLRETDNVRSGFEYETVPHVTLKSLANDEEPDREVLFDQALEDKKKIRVTGPFTVESLSPHRISDNQEMVSSERFVKTIIANMLRAGVQTGEKGARVEFVNLDILPSGPEVQASGEYKTDAGLKKVAVSVGPEFGSIDDDFVQDAARVAKKFADLLVIAATSFDASAFSVPAEIDGLRIMKVKINPDLSMGDLLKKTGSGNLFLAFGEPEVQVKEVKDGYTVEVVGVDVYDPVTSEIRSSGTGDPEHDIAAWFIDANYSGDAFFVTHAYFLGADKPYEKLKKALKANIDETAWDELYSTVSRPFPKPKTGKIAIKVINHYGDEVMKVVQV